MSDQPENDTSDGGAMGEDNDLIRSLRDQLKEANAKVKASDTAVADAKAEARTEFKREQATQRYVDAAGYPGLTDVVLDKVDGDITADTVLESLQALSLPVDVEAMKARLDGQQAPADTQPDTEGVTSTATAQDVADTANLGARVSAAAQGQDVDGVETDLDNMQAVSQQDAINQATAIAQKGGFYDPS
jgi:hypothetical protein